MSQAGKGLVSAGGFNYINDPQCSISYVFPTYQMSAELELWQL